VEPIGTITGFDFDASISGQVIWSIRRLLLMIAPLCAVVGLRFNN
jgi:hypothetical protein